MKLTRQQYKPGWQFVRDTLRYYNFPFADFARMAGFDRPGLYVWLKDKHDPKAANFFALCQALSIVNQKPWPENARIIFEHDYKRGDKL